MLHETHENEPVAPRMRVVRSVALLLLLFAGSSLVGVAFAESKPSLLVNGETLVGRATPALGVDAFLGVPYAMPPVAALRWQPPREYRGGGGTRQAGDFAPACMQSMRILEWYRGMAERFGASRSAFGDLAISEDCLYLNVWAPARSRADRAPRSLEPNRRGLPVMVFVHGGSNRSGWSFEPNYDGHRLAAEGVVVVSIAYRLGVFGFFSHPQSGANFGLQDQLEALRWVQRHIADFGGDPQRVTLFGESAGAGNIAALMLSSAARGLLQRAILQSGGDFGLPRIRSLAEEQARSLQLARAFDARNPPDLEGLRRIDAPRLLQIAEELFRDHYHAPVIDGQIITAQLEEQLKSSGWPLRELMIGTNTNEYFSAEAGSGVPDAVDRAVAAAELLNTREVRDALRTTPDAPLALDRLATAESMLCPAQWLATGVARAGRPVWMYQFARVREGAAAAALQAYHGAELPYVFGTHDDWLPTSATDRRLTQEMMRAWVEFARSGSPASTSGPRWPRFVAPGRDNVLRWDTVSTVIDSPEAVLCRVYRERLARRASQ